MTERAYVFETVQVGVEATPGTAVPANRKLNSLSIAIRPQVETTAFRPMGSKADSLVIPGKDYSTAKVTGKPVFDELPYPLSGLGTTGVTASSAIVTPPAAAPTATESAAGGTLPAGTYTYEVTFCQGGQETTPGAASTGAVCTGATSSVALTAIPTAAAGEGVTARRIYRANGGAYGLVATINDNTTTAWTDTGAMAPGAVPPATNQTGGYAWTGELTNGAPDALKTFTVQMGSSVRAAQVAGMAWTGFGFTADRSRWDLTGDLVGQSYVDNTALTANPTQLALVPALPKQIDLFLDTDPHRWGMTPLTRAFSLQVAFANRQGPVWPLSTTFASWAALVEMAPKLDLKLRAEMDAQGGTILAALKAGQTLYLRLKATGGAIPGIAAGGYSLCWDFAVVPNQGGDLASDNGVTVIDFPLTVVDDPTWGHSNTWTVTGALAAL